jgi:hypothetical protein
MIICVNGSEEMKKGEEAIGGQLWIQGNRRMTAHNHVQEGLANTRESAILSAAADAVTWTHALEIDGPRKGQRAVIYPKELSKLEQVLETRDPSIDTEDGHATAYVAILPGWYYYTFSDVESTPGGVIGVKAHPAVLIASLHQP